MTFGEYLKTKRTQRGKTQLDLAEYLGVSNVFVHQLEMGKTGAPAYPRCEQIAQFLRLKPADVWRFAQRERLMRFMQREEIEKKDMEILTGEETLLIKLYRVLDDDMKKDFNGMIFTLFKRYENFKAKKILNELIKCA